MKFVKKCPKCGGNVQTKSIRKSIGLGFVEIPVAQFCLNPVCDWYQDFTETRKPGDIKEGVIQIKVPLHASKVFQELLSQKETQKNIVIMGGIIALVVILLQLLPLFLHPPATMKMNPAEANTSVINTTQAVAVVSTQTPALMSVLQGQKRYSVKVDVAHGFNPKIMMINISDTIMWNNEENQRTRVILVSKEGLFENQLMGFSQKFPYQFNWSGNYTFALAEFGSLKEYPNAAGRVIVR